MGRTDDAYGESILAYYEGRSSSEIVERDDGYFGVSAGAPAYFAAYRSWPAVEKRAIKLAAGRVLDAGCGAGRVALYLQERGLDVTGIDVSPLAVKICRKRGVRKARVMSFYDIGAWRGPKLDTVVMFGNNFGLFGSAARAQRLLRALCRVTRPGATILAESIDPSTTNPVHRAYQRRNRRRGRMPGQLRIRIRFECSVGRWFDYLIVSPAEMEQLLKDSPWRLQKLYHSDGPLYTAVIRRG